jgi:hypothetical protein
MTAPAGDERKPAGPAGYASQTAADPVIAKIRMILENGGARVVGRRGSNGNETYSIALPDDPSGASGGHAVRWTLRVAADGRPLEVRIESGDGATALETITWDTYEVVPAGDDADRLTTLRGAHPDARVVRDAAALDAAAARMFPGKSTADVVPPASSAKPGR